MMETASIVGRAVFRWDNDVDIKDFSVREILPEH
jgi:hypothetical protein